MQGCGGKSRLDPWLLGVSKASQFGPCFALRDLDHDAPCPGQLVARLIPARRDDLIVRVVVRSAEAWLLADSEALASYLHISEGKIPVAPEAEDNPKRTIVALARLSSKKDLVRDMVPLPGESRVGGPGYEHRLVDFATNHWRPQVGRPRSPSLDRCLLALARLAERLRTAGPG